MSLFNELKRRNVFRVAIAYVIVGWLLMQVSEIMVPALHLPGWILTATAFFLMIGFPLAMIFAWAFELTPEGLKRDHEVDRERSITLQTGKKLDRMIIFGLLAVIMVMGVERIWFAGTDEPESGPLSVNQASQEPASSQQTTPLAPDPKTIAVLPFVDMSENQDQGWFANGLAEEILNTLARAPDLMVSSRTSSFKYRNTELDIPGIAKELGVAHILEGSVRRAGDRIRVTAQLIRAGDGFHLWSENFDRSAEDVISIQEDLAINIAKALKTTMDPVALEKMLQAGTRSVAAYEHYLNGLASETRLQETSDFSLTIDALNHFEMAREADPGFAAAHHQSARIWRSQLVPTYREHGVIDVTFQQAFVNFRERMIAAVENAPDETRRMLYEAELATAELRGAEAVRLLRRVLENLPNSIDATVALARAALFSRDTEAGILAVDNLLRLGDITAIEGYLNFVPRFVLPEPYIASALEQVRRFPHSRSIIYQAHRALLWAGKFEEAHKLYPRLAEETGRSRWFVDARQACSLGDRGEAEQILRTARQQGSGADLWYILVLLGEHEEAARVLKPYELENVPSMLGAFLTYPQFDPRPFPVLMSVLEREGIDWPPPREIPFACPPATQAEQASVAVLPFENISQDAANDPFTIGIHDDLLTKISKIGSIRTISRTSVLRYRGSDKTIPQIAADLGVSTLLEGGVQRVGDSVRINVQLIDAASDEHLWAETYDRDLSAANIFAIQSEIATEIARALKATLTPDDQRRLRTASTNNLAALEAYFEGKQLADERTRVSIEASIKKFEEAISNDPEFALAHSGLAYAWVLLPEYSASVDRELTRQKSVQAYTRALELDPDLPEGLTYKAWSEMVHRYDWASAETLLRRSLEVQANNPDTLHWLSHVLSFQGQHDEAIKVAEKAVESDPFSPLMKMNLSYILMDDRQYERSIKLRDETLELQPDYPELWRNMWLTFLRAARYSDATHALSNWASGTGRNPQTATQLGRLLQGYPETGMPVELPKELLDELEIGSENLAQVYAAAGDGEAALAALRVALDERAGSRSVLSMKINPLYDFIRDDPRFVEMQEQAGLAP